MNTKLIKLPSPRSIEHTLHTHTNSHTQQLHEEKISAIEEKLELAEQKLEQHAKLQPDMEEQLKARMEALTKVGNKVCTRTNMRADRFHNKYIKFNLIQYQPLNLISLFFFV